MTDQRTPPPAESPCGSPARAEPRRRVFWYFMLMVAAIQLVAGPKIQLSQWVVSGRDNAAVAEGLAWMKGQVNLDQPRANGPEPDKRIHDTAYFNRKVYNVFPPLMAILTVLLSPIHSSWLMLPDGFWTQTTYTLLVFWPLPIVGFLVFRRQTRDTAWGAFLTLAWIAGTAVLPNLEGACKGYLGQINHVLSQVGLLIFAADVLGRRRIWPALIGLAIATYSRQLTFLYGLPLLWMAWRQSRGRAVLAALGLAVIAAPLLTLNYLKFGDPLDFGYKYIYAGRENIDEMADRARAHGVFSPAFIADNLYYQHIAPPGIDVDGLNVRIYDRDANGTSLWITTPLAALVFITARWWWRDPFRRALMLGTLPVLFGLLLYHSPGFVQHGYSRFALDFLPIWLVVIAPQTRDGWRTHFTLGCAAWSLLYFQAIPPSV